MNIFVIWTGSRARASRGVNARLQEIMLNNKTPPTDIAIIDPLADPHSWHVGHALLRNQGLDNLKQGSDLKKIYIRISMKGFSLCNQYTGHMPCPTSRFRVPELVMDESGVRFEYWVTYQPF